MDNQAISIKQIWRAIFQNLYGYAVLTNDHTVGYTGWAKNGTAYVEPLNFIKY